MLVDFATSRRAVTLVAILFCRNGFVTPGEYLHSHMTHHIQCAEIWGGVRGIVQDVCTRGLSASIYSRSSDGERGGDIYYLSVCAYDILTRIAIIDVRGHGREVVAVSEWLYALLLEHMNSLDGAAVLAGLNDLVVDRGFHAISTAAILSLHRREGTLCFTYAGHPPLLLRQQPSGWTTVLAPAMPGAANLPLGVRKEIRYDQGSIPVYPGDRLCLFTDGVTECANAAGELWGDDRLCALLADSEHHELPQVRDRLVGAFESFGGANVPQDDCTFLLAEVLEQHSA
jgi:sigma-B regulation protein RsbU (phosphoserine phosphatase)